MFKLESDKIELSFNEKMFLFSSLVWIFTNNDKVREL